MFNWNTARSNSVSDKVLSSLPTSPRIRMVVDTILADAQLHVRRSGQHDVFASALSGPGPAVADLVEDLWNAASNQDLVQEFMTNKLCVNAAKGDVVAKEAFKKYAVQDYFYLIDFVKFRALRLTTVPQQDYATLESETTSVGKSYGYAKDWYDQCQSLLKVDPQQKERSVAELAYANVIQNTHGENWFSLHVIMLGCYYGWSKLAVDLYATADKTTDFYKMWLGPSVVVNPDGTASLSDSAVKIANFLNANQPKYHSDVQAAETTRLFRLGLRLEIAMFNEAYNTDY